MLGNDVVDLELAAVQSNWRRRGFLQKVFLTEEQLTISSCVDRDQMVWLLWSMKEAAYKAHQRRFKLPRKLNWLRQRCLLKEVPSGSASGKVRIGNYTYSTTSEVTADYIHTVATNLPEIGFKNHLSETSSDELKKHLIQQIFPSSAVPDSSPELRKNNHGIPYIRLKNGKIFGDFSLSDHGRFVACSFAVNDL